MERKRWKGNLREEKGAIGGKEEGSVREGGGKYIFGRNGERGVERTRKVSVTDEEKAMERSFLEEWRGETERKQY